MKKALKNPIDEQIGWKVHEIRKQVGVSQAQVAHALGVSFQQVQKYEKGSNRIAAGTLYRLAQFLGIPVTTFFPRQPTVPPMLTAPHVLGVLWCLHSGKNKKVQKRVSQLLQEVHKEDR